MEEIRQVYKIGKITFDSKTEYLAGQRDLKKIASFHLNKEPDDREVAEILKKIRKENITFESIVGEEFLNSIKSRLYHHRNFVFRRIVMIISYLVIGGCLLFFCVDGILEYRSRKEVEELRRQIENAKVDAELAQLAPREKTVIIMEEGKTTVAKGENILPEYQTLYKENQNFIGWLSIEGTGISYPVTYGPDNEYYLSHNLKKEYDKNGMLIMDIRCALQNTSPQYIIYGHNVQSGRMFGELLNYKDRKYYRYHPEINFNTLTEYGTYEIISTFIVSVEDDGELEKFYEYDNFASEEEFNQYIKLIQQRSIYDTGITPVYGEPLLSLVTCEYTLDGGRLVVVAGKKN